MYKEASYKYEQNISKNVAKVLNIYFDDVLIDPVFITEFKKGGTLFSKDFELGGTPSQYIEIKIHKRANLPMPEQIRVEFGVLVNNALTLYEVNQMLLGELDVTPIRSFAEYDDSFEMIPMGIYNVDDYNNKDNNIITIRAYDNIIKLEADGGYYDASELISENGYATLGEIAEDICTKKDLELGSKSFLNSDTKIYVYDNSITARQYMGYIAECAGCFVCAGRDGKLYFKSIGEDTIEIPQNLFKTYKYGEEYTLSKVAYENGAESFKFGYEIGNTLWLDPDNLFLVEETQVQKIYNKMKDLTIYGFEGTVIIDPRIDIGDIVNIDGKKIIYQGEITFGGNPRASIKSKISIKAKSETTVRRPSQKTINRRVQSQIDEQEGKITQLVEETTETSERLTQYEQTINGIATTVSSVETTIETAKAQTVSKVEVQYALSNSETTAPAGGWSTTAPAWTNGKYMWQKTVTTYADGTSKETSATCISGAKGQNGVNGKDGIDGAKGDKGDKGDPGVAGKDGAPGAKGDKGDQGATGPKGDTGAQGPQGPAGTSITVKSTAITYQAGTSGTTKPTGTWSATIPTVGQGQYLWTKTVVTYSDNKSTEAYSVAYVGKNGTNGTNGTNGQNGTSSYTHIRYSASSDGSNMSTNPANMSYIGVYTGTSSTAPAAASSYTWAKFKGDTGAKGATGATGAAGKNGNGINSITYYYAVTSNQTVPAASSVTNTTIPTLTATNKYLWQKEIIDFTDSTVADKTTVVLLAVYGDKGNTGAKGDKGDKGNDGTNGISVTKVEVEYYLSTSSASQSGGSWSTTAPAWANGKYMWSRTKTTLSNGTSTTTSPVCITGAKGSDGAKGDKGDAGTNGATGAAGTGVSNITTEFYLSTSKTAQTGGSWVTTMPTWENGKYLWTRSKIVYTNPSSTVYTTPQCDSSWEAVNEVQADANNAMYIANNATATATNASDIARKAQESATNIQEQVNELQTDTEKVITEIKKTVETTQTNSQYAINIAQSIAENGVTKLDTKTGFTFDEKGLTIKKTGAETETTLNEIGLNIKDSTGHAQESLLFAGYDNETGETIVKSKNMTVEKYLTIGKNSRVEDYETGTGIFYMGE